MGKKMFTIGIPCIFTGILFVVIIGIYGLNNVDKTMAKANARKAFASAYSDFVEGEVDATKLFKLFENEKFSHLGTLKLTDTSLLNNAYISLINNVPIEFNVLRYPSAKVTKAGIALGGDGQIHFEGYVNSEDIIFKISEFNEDYFSIPNSNIKEKYKESLWFNLLGDITTAIPDNFSLDLYGDVVLSDYILSDYLKECAEEGTFEEIIDGISFDKTDMQKDFLVTDTYVAANEYKVKVSKSAMEGIINLIAGYTKNSSVNEISAEKYEFLVYISDDNRLLGAKFNLTVPYEDNSYDTDIFLSFLGRDNIFDKVILDIGLTGQDKSVYSLRLLFTSTYEDELQNTIFIIAMNQPYVTRLCEVEVERNIKSDGLVVNAAVNVPGLKGNINYTGAAYPGEILPPEKAYAVYELNLWQILNIYSSTNWSFIK